MNDQNNQQLNNQKPVVVSCSRCGAPMYSNARYCMKCGNLNYNHEANASMKKYMNKEENQFVTYHVGSEEYINENTIKKPALSFANNTGNQMLCFLFNFCFYLLILFISYGLVSNGRSFMETIKSIEYVLILIIVSLLFFYFYSLEYIFIKCNKRWWTPFVPIYNIIEYSDIVFNKRWQSILFFIPITMPFVYIVSLVNLAKKFNKSPVSTVLFPFVVIPIIGFGGASYSNEKYVFGNQKQIERNYLFRRILEFTFVIGFSIGLLFFLVNNKNYIKYIGRQIANVYYVYTSHVITHKVKAKITHNFYSCNNNEVGGDDYYYFYYPDVGKKSFLLFYHSRDAIEGYVKFDKINNKYYVSLTDGKYGFPETESTEVRPSTVVKYESIPVDFELVTTCES